MWFFIRKASSKIALGSKSLKALIRVYCVVCYEQKSNEKEWSGKKAELLKASRKINCSRKSEKCNI